ncbi:MAG: endonuclease III [Defluviitaleaceae bacterium]|nr:endonuclease III [Defluviitaleaceae bacterium]
MPRAKVKRILAILDELYPFDGVCFLDYDHAQPWQLLFATILSAQCTDARVNQVTASLFRSFPTLEAFAVAPISSLEEAVRSTGFFRAKANHLQTSAKLLLANFGGQLPSDIDQLTSLSGVGRKTANVVRGHIFKLPSVVVDTHVMRVSRKLGLTQNKDPVKIEHDLMKILPKASWIPYNQQIITHGRLVCVARSPKCGECVFNSQGLCGG